MHLGHVLLLPASISWCVPFRWIGTLSRLRTNAVREHTPRPKRNRQGRRRGSTVDISARGRRHGFTLLSQRTGRMAPLKTPEARARTVLHASCALRHNAKLSFGCLRLVDRIGALARAADRPMLAPIAGVPPQRSVLGACSTRGLRRAPALPWSLPRPKR